MDGMETMQIYAMVIRPHSARAQVIPTFIIAIALVALLVSPMLGRAGAFTKRTFDL